MLNIYCLKDYGSSILVKDSSFIISQILTKPINIFFFNFSFWKSEECKKKIITRLKYSCLMMWAHYEKLTTIKTSLSKINNSFINKSFLYLHYFLENIDAVMQRWTPLCLTYFFAHESKIWEVCVGILLWFNLLKRELIFIKWNET